MSRKPAIVVLGIALVLSGPVLAAQGSLLEDERLADVRSDLEALFERVQEAGLPGALFEAKVREGLVKKVPSAKIVGALGVLEKRCLEGKKLLQASGLKPTPGRIGSVTQALAAGVSSEDVGRLLCALVEAKAGQGTIDKSLLVVVMMREGGTEGSAAVDGALAIVHASGSKGLDDWIKKHSKSTKKTTSPTKGKKGKAGKKKHKAKGKAPGKSHGK
jgi:hypothetical protein